MDRTHTEVSVETPAAAFDTLARSLHLPLPRRRLAGLLAAALATAVVGSSTHTQTAEAAKRKRRKRGKRRDGAESVSATAIPPNCIRVCCDGTCDSWKMCWRCVTWPTPTTTTTLARG
jgi:hypothetical protein